MNFSCRCGCRLNACQVRQTASWETPKCAASDRVDQCVACFGVLSNVVVTIRSTCSSVTVLGRPGRGSSNNPSSRRSAKRLRHLDTVGRDTRSRSAISTFETPSAAARTIRERNAQRLRRLPPTRPRRQAAPFLITQRDNNSSRSRMNHPYPNCKRWKPTGH